MLVGIGVGALVCSTLLGCSPRSDSEGLAWRSCGSTVDVMNLGVPPDRLPHLSFGCATLEVPLVASASAGEEAAGPGGATVRVHLVRVRHDDGSGTSAAKEPLLLIAGGPGQSGIDNAVYAAGYFPAEALDRFDLVGFDPRGVGRSDPIECERFATPPLVDVSTEQGYAVAAASTREGTARCLERLGAEAGHYNTTETAMDIDLIRRALGQEVLTYVGWSYGAKLGAEYARLFPSRVRAAVLDAPTDPTVTWLETTQRQVAGFEDSFARFVSWCAERSDCDGLGDVRASTLRLVTRAELEPVPSGRPGDDVPSNGTDLLNGIASALYDDTLWPDLAEGLAEAAEGDSGTLRGLADIQRGGTSDDANPVDALFVVNCNDSAPWPSETEIRAASRRLAEEYPVFGRWGSLQLLMCAFWSPARHTLEPPVAATSNRVLVVGTVHDPATPYAGAAAMTASLGNATLLTWEGASHAAFGRSSCIGAHVAAYLTDLVVPPDGTRCPP